MFIMLDIYSQYFSIHRFLGISEDVSLRVKSGVLKIGAFGDYLKDVQRRDNYVEILVKTTYETFSETLHGTAHPIQDWDLLSPTYLGTHFCRSITYGGIMLASLRLYVGNKVCKTILLFISFQIVNLIWIVLVLLSLTYLRAYFCRSKTLCWLCWNYNYVGNKICIIFFNKSISKVCACKLLILRLS